MKITFDVLRPLPQKGQRRVIKAVAMLLGLSVQHRAKT